MYTIDLLKGQGIPTKTSPLGIAIVVATPVVPAIAVVIMIALYLHNRIVINVQDHQIDHYKTKAAELLNDVQQQRTFESQKALHANCLSEVNSFVTRYFQWSAVLTTLVDNLPESLVLNALEIGQSSVKRKVPKKDDPQKIVDLALPVKTLKLTVCGSTESDNNSVKQFRESLRVYEFLGSKLENIAVSQQARTLNGKDVVSYEIDCVFKPKL